MALSVKAVSQLSNVSFSFFRYMYAGAAHADNNEYGPCVTLWNYALRLKMEKETLLSCDTAFTARAIVQLYVNIMFRYMNNPDPFDDGPLRFDDILTTSQYIRDGIDTALQLLQHQPICQSQKDNFDIVLTTWIHLVHILLQLAESEIQMASIFHEVMPMISKPDVKLHKTGDSMLHMAVNSATTLHSNSFLDGNHEENNSPSGLQVFPSLPVTDFLLRCGHDIHAKNNLGETPLHLSVKTENFAPEVAKKLLDYGAHLDLPDLRDICPYDIIKAQKSSLKLNLVPYVSLKCLATQVIVRERVPFTSQDLPWHLDQMVQMHLPNLPAISLLDLEINDSDLEDFQ